MDIPVQTKTKSLIGEKIVRHDKEFSIQKGEVYTIRTHTMPFTVKSLEGILWVTRENDPQDYILQRCQSVSFADGGPIVIQSLSTGKFRIISE